MYLLILNTRILEGLTPSYDSTTLRSQLHQMLGLLWRGGAEYVTQEKSIGRQSIQPWVPDSNSYQIKWHLSWKGRSQVEGRERLGVWTLVNIPPYGKTTGKGNKSFPLISYLKYLENCLILYNKCSICISYYCSFKLVHLLVSRHRIILYSASI